MKDSPFFKFINLVSIDQKIQVLGNKKVDFEKKIYLISQQKREQESLLEQAHQKVVLLKKNVDFQELEMKILDSKEKEKKTLLDTLSDYRECQALKNEIDGINRLQVAQEKIILDAWAQLESAQLFLEKKEVELAELDQKYKKNLATINEDERVISDELDSLVEQRSEKLFGIPQEWLDKYELMGQKVENPVVAIEHQSCGGCYQQLTSQDIIRARHGALMQCKKCFRLLYLAEAIEQ